MVTSEPDRNPLTQGLTVIDFLIPLATHLRLLVVGPLLCGLIALGITYLIAPTFTARTTFISPQQQQSAAAAALASLGALSSLPGLGGNGRTPGDQYMALLQSNVIRDKIIDEFKLMEIYRAEFRADARDSLDQNVRVIVGKKDGMITIEVDDKSAQRAAEIANRHVDELRQLTSGLAMTEAQQRRVFFEGQLGKARDNLTKAQQALQVSGFNSGALRAEPKATADAYARLQAEATMVEISLEALRRSHTESSPEVQQQLALIHGLRSRLREMEKTDTPGSGPDYIGAYRNFKYHETMFEMFSRQYELARVDESREGALIQVVDVATPPERKSKPKRAVIAVVGTLAGVMFLVGFVLSRHFWREAVKRPESTSSMSRLRNALENRERAS